MNQSGDYRPVSWYHTGQYSPDDDSIKQNILFYIIYWYYYVVMNEFAALTSILKF